MYFFSVLYILQLEYKGQLLNTRVYAHQYIYEAKKIGEDAYFYNYLDLKTLWYIILLSWLFFYRIGSSLIVEKGPRKSCPARLVAGQFAFLSEVRQYCNTQQRKCFNYAFLCSKSIIREFPNYLFFFTQLIVCKYLLFDEHI